MTIPAEDSAGLLDTLWQPRALAWLMILVLALALALELAPGRVELPLTERAVRFGVLAFGAVWVLVLTICALYLVRRRLAPRGAAAAAWAAFGFLLCATALVTTTAWFVAPPAEGTAAASLTELLARYLALAGVVGLPCVGAFQAFWQNRVWRSRVQRSELAAVQARTRPHFLFNTLNAATALVRNRPEAVEGMLLDLSDLLRAALAAPQEWPLASELELTRKYLGIEAHRFGERLAVDWDVPEPPPATLVPMLSIQPLVENAVLHGIERRPAGGRIGIRARLEGGMLEVRVANDPGDPSLPRHAGHGVGVEAVRQRLAQFTGGRGELRLAAGETQFEALLRVPHQAPTTS